MTLAAAVLALAAVSTPALFDYQVRAHETLYDIGQRGLSPPSAFAVVQRLNHVRDPYHLPVGKVLKIPYALLRSTPIPATLESFHGAVEIDHAPARVGVAVNEGALLTTGTDGFVRLALPDGTHVAIPSNSRVRVDRLRSILLDGALDRALTLQTGRADSTVTPMSNPDSRYVITTPVASTAVRGTLFRVAYDAAAQQSSVGVLRGVVDVAGANNDRLVGVDQGVIATRSGVGAAETLLPAPVLVHGEFPQTDASLRFEIAPVPGAARYHLTLASDAAIAHPLLERTTTQPEVTTPSLPDGSYYAEVAAIAPSGLEGRPAVSGFVRLRNALTGSEARRTQDGYLFRWTSPGETPATFHFELRKAGEAGPPVYDNPALSENHVLVKTLPPGVYTWRVTATRTLAGRRAEAWFDPQTLDVPK